MGLIITRQLLAVLLTLSSAALLRAQTEGEAPTDGSAWIFADPPPVRLAQSTEAISRPALVEAPGPSPGVRGDAPRRGLLQNIQFVADWVPRLEDDSVGRSTLSAAVGLGVPPFVFGSPVLITPRAAIHSVTGPNLIDAPSTLNDLEISFGTFKKFSDRWMARLNVTVGVYGDDHSLNDSDALRVSGVGVAIYNYSPEWQWAFGAAYLNRDDISVVPAVGVIRDCGDVRYEIMMPRPRIVWRLPQDGSGVGRSIYLAGELGGGAWAVRRDDGTTDTLNLSRWGLVLGFERAAAQTVGMWAWGGWKTRYEIGYLFGRSLEYANSDEEISLDDSLVARVGWSY